MCERESVEMRTVPCSCWTEPADVTHWLSAQQAQETDPAGWWGGGDRGGHTHINTDTQQRAKYTLMLMQKSTGRSETKRGYKHKHTHTRESLAASNTPTTQDDILPAKQEREQPSTLMRRLTFIRLWHTETEQFRLIHQISCFCQPLAHNGVRYLFPCIPLSHITVLTRNTTESSMEYSRTRVHTHSLRHMLSI